MNEEVLRPTREIATFLTKAVDLCKMISNFSLNPSANQIKTLASAYFKPLVSIFYEEVSVVSRSLNKPALKCEQSEYSQHIGRSSLNLRRTLIYRLQGKKSKCSLERIALPLQKSEKSIIFSNITISKRVKRIC